MSVQNSIPAGDIRFIDNCIPALEADDYVLSAAQTAHSTDEAHPLDESFPSVQTLSVVAPRFALPPADIQSVFPPANAAGIFDQNFAHVVMTERALPWERLIDAADDKTRGVPWMALLLFTEDQIVPPAGTREPSALTNPTLAGSYPVEPPSVGVDSLLKPAAASVLGPKLTARDTDETACQAIDITTAVFTQLVPRMADLAFLAHVREAADALEHKVLDQAVGAGWYSVVIGNRLPSAQSTTGSGEARYIAHLVSLEGFVDYLVDQPVWPAGITTVRLASLASWSFRCQEETGNFAALARQLAASPIASVKVTAVGSGYTSDPDVTVKGDGSGALLASTVTEGAVSAVTVIDAGAGYTSAPVVGFSGGGGTGAAAAAATLGIVGGNMLRLRLPVTLAPQAKGSAEALAQGALLEGYTAPAYDTRVGDHSFGWYHGPFVPSPVLPFSAAQPFASAAAATIYDKATGLFDLTYAAAWEMGRLMALSAQANSTTKMALTRLMRRNVNLLRERMARGGAGNAAASAESLSALIDGQEPSRKFVEWMGTSLGERLPRAGKKSHVVRPRVIQNRTVQAAAAALPELERQAAVQSFLEVRLKVAMREPQVGAVLDWAAGLRLLEGVPFNVMVPNAAMLPAESIRFFYVDPNYLDALTDGADSLGLQTSRDQAYRKMLRPALRGAVRQRSHRLRLRRISLGKAGPVRFAVRLAAEPLSTDPVVGLLLRSAIVKGWPGLEVKAYAATIVGSSPLRPDPASLISPLRLDRVSPDVLLCLYPQIPVWLELDEPKEGLAFGVEDPAQVGQAPQVALRYLDDTGGRMGSTTGTFVDLSAQYFRDTQTRVIDVTAWQQYLSTQVPKSPTVWGPAAYAIQMVRAPEQMIFQNPGKLMQNDVEPAQTESASHA